MNSSCISLFFSNVVTLYAVMINSNICRPGSSKMVVTNANKTSWSPTFLGGCVLGLSIHIYLWGLCLVLPDWEESINLDYSRSLQNCDLTRASGCQPSSSVRGLQPLPKSCYWYLLWGKLCFYWLSHCSQHWVSRSGFGSCVLGVHVWFLTLVVHGERKGVSWRYLKIVFKSLSAEKYIRNFSF